MRKEKSDKQRWTIDLVPTPKIIDLVKKTCPSTLLVGFKLEVGLDREALIASAKNLMERSGADLAVANDMADVQGNAYKAILLQRLEDGTVSETAVKGRSETALLLCDRLGEMLAGSA
jgi:phosphopantothenoylcysteine synthetase/decarboxylase